MPTTTLLRSYATYSDADLDNVAAGFAAAYETEVNRTARRGFGDGGWYHLTALHGVALEMNRRHVVPAPLPRRGTTELPVRRGARVLYAYSNVVGVGYVEGESFHGDGGWSFVFRHQDGSIGYCPQGLARLVAVDAGTVLVEDQFNNVGRLCNVRGDGAAGYPNRCWIVAATVSGSRYLVRHLDYGTVALVGHRDMTNLY